MNASCGGVTVNDTIKMKVMGWSASVGLTALSLLGQGPASAEPGVASDEGNSNVTNRLAAHSARADRSIELSQSSPPPPPWFSPPPPPPPAIGGVRG